MRAPQGVFAWIVAAQLCAFPALGGVEEWPIAATAAAQPAAEIEADPASGFEYRLAVEPVNFILPAGTEPGDAAGEPWVGELVALGQQPDPLFDDDFDDAFDPAPEVYDPFESGNRVILSFNQGLDKVLWSPITKVYRLAVPEPGRRGLRRVLANLNTPIYVVNHILQLRPLAAAETLGAFVMNSTFGIGGFLDAAESVGLERREADFGQTLALAGVGAGPYIVVPVLGPSTFRDGFGWVVDRAFHPATYFLGIPIQIIWRGGAGVAEREAVADALEALEESSLDYYSVLRSAYSQARERQIEANGPDDSATLAGL